MADDQAEAFTDALCESASIDTSAAAADAEEGNAAIAAFAMASEAAVKAASGRGRGQKWICRRCGAEKTYCAAKCLSCERLQLLRPEPSASSYETRRSLETAPDAANRVRTRGGKDDRVGRRFVASGPSRRWEKRWTDHGHLRVCKWQRVEEN